MTPKQLTGVALAKRDLENHFQIRKGEKWTNPNFGSMLPFYVMEPLDNITVDLVKQDVLDVISYDPRFSIEKNTILVDFDESKIEVNATLNYIPTSTPVVLELKFDREFEEL
jgi:phage baseplate assembly protein W